MLLYVFINNANALILLSKHAFRIMHCFNFTMFCFRFLFYFHDRGLIHEWRYTYPFFLTVWATKARRDIGVFRKQPIQDSKCTATCTLKFSFVQANPPPSKKKKTATDNIGLLNWYFCIFARVACKMHELTSAF